MTRPGLHWANSNLSDPAVRARFARARPPVAVCLDTAPVAEACWIRLQVARLIVRLYESIGELPPARVFVERHCTWIDQVDRAGWYQLLNEPDREYPSTSPAGFSTWWLEAAALLRERFPGIRLGFPAPSISEGAPYLASCAAAIAAADFIGERGYWQPRSLMLDQVFGWRWLRSAGFGRPVILTEYGCSDPQLDKASKAQAYLDYCATLPRFVVPAGAFILAGGDPQWDTPAAGRLWIDDAMCAALGSGRGAREEVAVSQEQVRTYAPLIVAAARSFNLQPSLVAGLIDVESGGQEHATSPDNGPGLGHAVGLMQVLEGNFAAGQNGYDPATNLAVGCRILRAKLDAFGGRIESGLAAYFGAVDAQGNPTDGQDLTGTTGREYVAAVLGAVATYHDLDSVTTPATPGPGPAQGAPRTPGPGGTPADDDFKQYAPQTGTWREACVNLKGIADHALESGRRIVADVEQLAAAVAARWGGQ